MWTIHHLHHHSKKESKMVVHLLMMVVRERRERGMVHYCWKTSRRRSLIQVQSFEDRPRPSFCLLSCLTCSRLFYLVSLVLRMYGDIFVLMLPSPHHSHHLHSSNKPFSYLACIFISIISFRKPKQICIHTGTESNP